MEEEDAIKMIVEMGFSRDLAKEALHKTNFNGIEEAILWIVSNSENPQSQAIVGQRSKMIFVVNNSLQMSKGKTSAQVAHAALGLYRQLLQTKNQQVQLNLGNWEETGETKIVVRAEDTKEIELLTKKAQEVNNLEHYVVVDAGRTEIPEGSLTVLGLFGAVEQVDKVTKELPLLA